MIWNDIQGYKGYYQLSECGSVRSIDRMVPKKDGNPYFVKGKVLSPINGMVLLSKDNMQHRFKIYNLITI